jgi:hypothetical protein
VAGAYCVKGKSCDVDAFPLPLGDADACDIALVELYEDIANSIEILLLVEPESSSPAPFRRRPTSGVGTARSR